MRVSLFVTLFLIGCSLHRTNSPKMLAVMGQDGVTYVAGSELERHAAIVVKTLPGSDSLVACSGERCTRLKDFVRKGDEIWVGTSALARVLGLSTHFSADRRSVRFAFATQEPPALNAIAQVGQLAPNFRVTKLDGSAVSLADLRGRRVLINSWASW